MFIQYGTQITKAGDTLEKIPLERLFLGISKPKQQFIDRIEQLRMVNSIDPVQYRELKKLLPYFVCGVFHPPVRRKEHFAAIELFIIDLDHLAAFDIDKTSLTEKLKNNPNVLLVFTSPGADGLKIMFRLSERCTDEALFSNFYKIFATRFAAQYGLQSVIDYNTSDVTRACFVSYDPEAYFNPEATSLEMKTFIPQLDFDRVEKEVKIADKIIKVSDNPGTDATDPIDEEVLQRIKEKLNPKVPKPQKQHYVPPEVDDALAHLSEKLGEYDLQIVESASISFGRKVKVGAGKLWAEINIFYGARGFSVVKTTKTGSNPELAELAAQAIRALLDEMEG